MIVHIMLHIASGINTPILLHSAHTHTHTHIRSLIHHIQTTKRESTENATDYGVHCMHKIQVKDKH